jgi:hypothetical protein
MISPIAVVDTSTKKVHVFSLKGGGKRSTIKEFVTTVEETLSGETEACVRVLCAAVGGHCINICDASRSVLYHLLDARPWFIATGTFSSKHDDVHIKDTAIGNQVALKMDFDQGYVRDLKQVFARMTCNSAPNLRFVYERRELEDDQKISDCRLTSGSVVTCVRNSRTRTASIGSPDVYISCKDQNGDCGRLSPVWRRATPGLWLEGKCSNKICVAYSKLVVMNQGFADLDLTSEKHACECPMCYDSVTPTGFGFSRCRWMTVGVKAALDARYPHVVRQEWQRLEEGFRCFDHNKDTWSVFKICCKELNSLDVCVVCMTRMLPKATHKVSCGHKFHTRCMPGMENCLQCVAEQSMTSYQNCFCPSL